MSPKIFLTGVTGYVGGDLAHVLVEKYPDFEYTFLVRNEERAKGVKERYPQANYVYGTLDDVDVIEKAAFEADVVIHNAESSDNVPSAEAIARGLEAGHTAEKPGYWINTSGTGILMHRDKSENRYGQPPHPDEHYDDIADIARILSLPDYAIHRNIEAFVQATGANRSGAVRTAIVSPPTIYGVGRGAGNTRSMQLPALAKLALEHRYAPIVGTGLTEWDQVHVADLADLFVKLVEIATAGDADGEKKQLAENPEVFGEKAYYFAEAGTVRWGEVAGWVADEINKQGYTPEPIKTKTVDFETATKVGGGIAGSYGINSKSFASRARKYLGWKPTRESLKDSIPEAVRVEAKSLGLEANKAT